jgi:hypothetical protein
MLLSQTKHHKKVKMQKDDMETSVLTAKVTWATFATSGSNFVTVKSTCAEVASSCQLNSTRRLGTPAHKRKEGQLVKKKSRLRGPHFVSVRIIQWRVT